MKCWGLHITSEQHLQNTQRTSAQFLCSTTPFACYVFVLSCNLKVSDGNCILLRLFKRYCGSPGSAHKTREAALPYYNQQRKQGNARVSHQLVYTRMSHQCCQPGHREKPLQSTLSNSVFSWVSPQNNTHVL